jgi:hypothetical protein
MYSILPACLFADENQSVVSGILEGIGLDGLAVDYSNNFHS